MSSLIRRLALFTWLVLAASTTAAADTTPTLDLAAHAGEVVYVDFWASWCGPCRSAYPWLQTLHERYAEQGLTVLTVNVDRDRAAAEKFLAALKADLPVIWDPEGVLATEYELQAMPTSYVFGRDGTLRASHVGFDEKKTGEIEAEIEALLAEQPEVDVDEATD
jgi:thiol-disulfide isomerase/thioredoxin